MPLCLSRAEWPGIKRRHARRWQTGVDGGLEARLVRNTFISEGSLRWSVIKCLCAGDQRRSQSIVYTLTMLFSQYTRGSTLVLNSSVILTHLATQQLQMFLMFLMFLYEALWCLHSHYSTPGYKETPNHRHLQIQNTTDREINHTTNGCWWLMGNCGPVVITSR